jgi:DNA-binding NarL/FixJ family response regulator
LRPSAFVSGLPGIAARVAFVSRDQQNALVTKTPPKKMRVILADPQTLVRAGIRRLIEAIAGVEVIAETGDGQELLQLTRDHRPDVVMTELLLNGMPGLDVAAQLRRHYPEVEVLICSGQTDVRQVRAVIKAGVSGYLAKDAEINELELALRAALRGQSYFSPGVSRIALEQRRQRRAEERPALTPRQRQVVQLLALPWSKPIARG